LPDGYFRDKGERDKGGQQSLYERAQEAATGLSKEERMLHVTQAWRASDSPKAFVRALEDLGYVLATGKRPYVLVDVYGEVNALPKLIDDKTVRTRDIRAFLGQEFPPESLPSMEEAQALIAQHRQALEDFNKARAKADELEKLKAGQAQRRTGAERDAAALKAQQAGERTALLRQQKEERSKLRAAYLGEMKQRRSERARHAPKGLAAFLGRITGVALVTKKIHQYRDRKRFETFLADRQRLKDRQGQERMALRHAQELHAADVMRKLRALDQVEQRERRSLETALLKQRRTEERRRHDHRMPPAPAVARAKTDTPKKARRVTNVHTSTLARELAERALTRRRAVTSVDLKEEFTRAAQGAAATGGEASKAPGTAETERRFRRVTGRRVVTDVNLAGDFEHAANRGESQSSGETDKAPKRYPTLADYRTSGRHVRTDVNLDGDFEHAATHRGNYTGEDSASSDGPNPPSGSTPRPPRPRRPRGKNKDFDRAM